MFAQPSNIKIDKKISNAYKKLLLVNLASTIFFVFGFDLFLNKNLEELAGRLVSGVKFELLSGNYRQVQKILVQASSGLFDEIKVINLNDDPKSEFYVFKKSASESPLTRMLSIPVNLSGSRMVYEIIFKYNLGFYAKYFILILIIQFLVLVLFLSQSQKKVANIISAEFVDLLCFRFAQVAHDIRSPYAVLKTYTKKITGIPEDVQKAIDLSVSRIDAILTDLETAARSAVGSDVSGPSSYSVPNSMISEKYLKEHQSISNTRASKQLKNEPGISVLLLHLDRILSEKRYRYHDNPMIDISMKFSAPLGVSIKADPQVFERVISNLIDNSAQATAPPRKNAILIEVKLSSDQSLIKVIISDTGKGIHPEILPKLFQRGATFGKEGGTGLGLYHAKTQVESWGGSIDLESEVNKGTVLTLTLPKEDEPGWIQSSLDLQENAKVLVVDDDPSIHANWDRLLRRQKVMHAITIEDAQNQLNENPGLILVDYELGDPRMTGLDFIKQNCLSHKSLLVTSRYDDFKIQEECQSLGLKILPKSLLPYLEESLNKGKTE